jgi:F-type H+-transporting ATPase subunit gamma
MPSLIDIRRRIRSVKNTQQITKAMKMVSAAKLRRAQDRVIAARPYGVLLRKVLANVAAAASGDEKAGQNPLLAQRPEQRILLVFVSGDKGLAGAFNSNLIKEARRRIETLEGEGYEVELYGVGKKGIGFFKYVGRKWALERTDIGDRPSADHAAEIAEPLIAEYEAGRLASVDLVQARFISALQTPPATIRILPVEPPTERREGATASGSRDYILAPSADVILEQLLPLYVRNVVYRGLVETAAAEHGARRTAMKNATDNAGEILEVLRRTYNRQRQAGITQEIAEIVGGAAALQG